MQQGCIQYKQEVTDIHTIKVIREDKIKGVETLDWTEKIYENRWIEILLREPKGVNLRYIQPETENNIGYKQRKCQYHLIAALPMKEQKMNNSQLIQSLVIKVIHG